MAPSYLAEDFEKPRATSRDGPGSLRHRRSGAPTRPPSSCVMFRLTALICSRGTIPIRSACPDRPHSIPPLLACQVAVPDQGSRQVHPRLASVSRRECSVALCERNHYWHAYRKTAESDIGTLLGRYGKQGSCRHQVANKER